MIMMFIVINRAVPVSKRACPGRACPSRAFSRTARPNDFTLETVLPRVLSNTPAEREVNRANGRPENQRKAAHKTTDRADYYYYYYYCVFWLYICSISVL